MKLIEDVGTRETARRTLHSAGLYERDPALVEQVLSALQRNGLLTGGVESTKFHGNELAGNMIRLAQSIFAHRRTQSGGWRRTARELLEGAASIAVFIGNLDLQAWCYACLSFMLASERADMAGLAESSVMMGISGRGFRRGPVSNARLVHSVEDFQAIVQSNGDGGYEVDVGGTSREADNSE